jgi:hypothetical protein
MMQQHLYEAAGAGSGTPRDMPDQQAGSSEERDREQGLTDPDAHEDVPDTDEAGTGRRGDSPSPEVHPEQPVPDEPAD